MQEIYEWWHDAQQKFNICKIWDVTRVHLNFPRDRHHAHLLAPEGIRFATREEDKEPMHAKFMHEHFSLLIYIPKYLDVINMFLYWFMENFYRSLLF
jgi:hypothetical protein